jgi:tetratricopeptide (TPR) repeat protein
MWIGAIPLLFLLQVSPYEQGLKALDEKQYSAALDLFSKAIGADATDYGAHFNLGLTYSLLGDDVKAIPEYRKTLQLKPKLYQAELNLGISLLKTKEPADAISVLSDATELRPKEFRPNYYLAEALRAVDQLDRARTYYKSALEITPKSAPAEFGLGKLELKSKNLAEAAAHLRTAAELDATYRDGLLELAAAYEQQKQNEPAIEIYRQFPEDAGAQERLGELLLEAGKAGDAIPFFEESVKKSPTTANRVALAAAYLGNKQPDKALPILTAVLQAEPRNFDVLMMRGRLLRDARQFAGAESDFSQAAQIKPDAVQAWSELASISVVGENYPLALAALDRVAALHAEKPGHVYLRAIVFDKNRQLKPALESYRRFLSMSNGISPNEEFIARQRARILDAEINRR